MKKAVIIIIAGIMVSCNFDPTIEYRIYPGLQPYIDQFFIEAEKRDRIIPKENLDLELYDGLAKKEGDWGQSQRRGQQRLVLIDKEYFDFNTENNYPLRIEAIVFHELGHALLHRGHTDAQSIMNIHLCYSDYCYERQDFILDELFN